MSASLAPEASAVSPVSSRLIATGAASALIVLNLWHAFGGPSWLAVLICLAIVVLIVAGFGQINPRLKTTSFVLFALGVALLPFARDPWHAIARGAYVSALLLSLTASVMLLARCALRSRHVHEVGAGLRGQPANRRYLVFAAVSQLFCGALGLAGANIMYVMAAPPEEADAARRSATVVAVSRGFSAASCWSPVFGNMALMLVLYPTLHWLQVFPVGVALAQVSLGVGTLLDRRRARAAMPVPAGPRPEGPRPTCAEPNAGIRIEAAGPLLAVLLGFLVLILAAGHLLNIPVAGAIALVAPFVAIAFGTLMHPGRPSVAAGVRDLGQGMLQFPALASEAILFAAAGSAGSIMAAAFPDAWVAHIAHALGGHALPSLAFLLFAMIGTAVVGIHPVLSGVFLATTFTPGVLGLPALAHLGAVLAGWGLSTCMTPFSVLSLTASRYAGEGLYRISLGRNAGFAILSGLLISLLLSAMTAIAGVL
ncbi:MAG: hypothetical protein ACTHL1_03020 [Burkholderiaceae bacterium]